MSYFTDTEGLLTDLLNYHEEMRQSIMKELQAGGTFKTAAVIGKRITNKYVEKIVSEHYKEQRPKTKAEAEGAVKKTATPKSRKRVVSKSLAKTAAEVRGSDSRKPTN